MLNHRENYLRTVRKQNPQWIPVEIGFSDASLHDWKEDMEKVIARYPEFFPWYTPGCIKYDDWDFGPAYTADQDFTDSWGCTWRTARNGIEGVVINEPLAKWDAFSTYEIPDPMQQGDREPADWLGIEKQIRSARENDDLTYGSLSHGFLFMRLQYLRGFTNLMYDMVDEKPLLKKLIAAIDRHNLAIVNKYLLLGVDVMWFPEDLGTQNASILSPDLFRRWIKPSYEKLIQPCRQRGSLAAIHSDGYIMELIDDLLEVGLDIINPQDLCNGIDNLARELKGRACISLDIDRQVVVPFGSRQDIFDLIEEEVRKLGSAQGGLELSAGIYPPTPPENVDSLCAALKKYRTWWWD